MYSGFKGVFMISVSSPGFWFLTHPVPLRVKPGAQLHWNDPSVFTHRALISEQASTSSLHSSMSETHTGEGYGSSWDHSCFKTFSFTGGVASVSDLVKGVWLLCKPKWNESSCQFQGKRRGLYVSPMETRGKWSFAQAHPQWYTQLALASICFRIILTSNNVTYEVFCHFISPVLFSRETQHCVTHTPWPHNSRYQCFSYKPVTCNRTERKWAYYLDKKRSRKSDKPTGSSVTDVCAGLYLVSCWTLAVQMNIHYPISLLFRLFKWSCKQKQNANWIKVVIRM